MKAVIARLLNDQQVEWISTDSTGAQKLHRTDVSELPEDLPITLVIHGNDILCRQVLTPARNIKQIQQAVPYQLEDELVSDIDALHFAYSGLYEGKVDTLVIERRLMDGWIESLPEPSNVTVMVPDFMALSAMDNGWTLLIESDRLVARKGQHCGFSAEHDLGLLVLQQWYEQEPPETITIWKTKDAPELTLPFESEINIQIIQHPLQLFHHDLSPATSVNLRQGDYKSKQKSGSIRSSAWLRVAALFLVFVLVSFGLKISEYLILSQQLAETSQSIEQTFKQAFPDVKRIINPRVQMEQRVKSLRSSGTSDPVFLKLLAAFSNEFRPQDKIQLRDIQYRNNYLTIALDAESLQTLEDLKQRISSQSGVTAEISSATSVGNSIEAQLKLQEAS